MKKVPKTALPKSPGLPRIETSALTADVKITGPKMSGKGGVRLHPVRDGVIPLVREAHMRRRDKGGNTYGEVTDPTNGFCIGVTSPLTIPNGVGSVFQAAPMVPTKNPTRDAGILPQRAANGAWFQGTGTRKRVIRTTDMGDASLPSLGTRKHTQPDRRSPTVAINAATRAPKRAPKRATKPAAPLNGHQLPADMPTELVDVYIRVTCRKAGQPVPAVITASMRRAARKALRELEDIRAFCGEG